MMHDSSELKVTVSLVFKTRLNFDGDLWRPIFEWILF